MGSNNRCHCRHRIARHAYSEEKKRWLCTSEKCAPYLDFCDIQPKPVPTAKERWIAKCLGKVQFFTKKDADERKWFYQELHGTCLRVYRCPQCKYFHLTTSPYSK